MPTGSGHQEEAHSSRVTGGPVTALLIQVWAPAVLGALQPPTYQ